MQDEEKRDDAVKIRATEEEMMKSAGEKGNKRVLAKKSEDDFAHGAEAALDAGDAHGVDDVACEAVRDALRVVEALADPEDVVEVDVHDAAALALEEDVFAVAVAEAEDVADHGHDGGGVGEVLAGLVPGGRLGEGLEEPAVEDDGAAVADAVEELEARRGAGGPDLLPALAEGLGHLVAGLVAVDGGLHRARVGDPLDEAVLLVQREHAVRADGEAAPARVGAVLEDLVDEREDLHHARVDAHVLVQLAQERVPRAKRVHNHDLLGLHLRLHHAHTVLDRRNRRVHAAPLGLPATLLPSL